MTKHDLSRRTVLALVAGCLAIAPLRAAAPVAITVVKDPDCGCCEAWIDILRADGFAVTTQVIDYDALQALKGQSGIPEPMRSCHTARVEGYVIEGHVPPADIRRLLAERPAALGLAVPGMPLGAPGMGPEDQREAYDVHLITADGQTRIFAHYDAA
ncbi:DUF411 domain-containing protein [Rhodobacter capsulatus]|uniref:DUF411 domain-containing protein n=1 Tax=Rhodobacter capsulatus TaxID=1061 RepID=UPI0003D3B0E9|nr:DUF411 domain-containing protein [Rhodobacter capsulatus]ETD90301.1 hypothetical protein U713_05850 [Rhodobacter capsulatus YW2]